MRTDGLDVPSKSELHCQICIVGGGAAGITLAREWNGCGAKVLLLEAGGASFTAESQELYRPQQVVSHPEHAIDAGYVQYSRQRFFGGTTNHWRGWCRPLDPHDFEPRPWLAYSGWPIRLSELLPFYTRAAQYVEISQLETPAGGALDANFAWRDFYFSPPTRFASVHGPELFRSNNVEVLLGATVVRLEHNEGRVIRAHVRNQLGAEFTVRAELFVVASGGIENARLLLSSEFPHPAIGRYFMDHLQLTPGTLLSWDKDPWPKNYRREGPRKRVISTTAEFQRQNQLLNYSVELMPARTADSEPLQPLLKFCGQRAGPGFDLRVRGEIEPNPRNRVELGTELDRMGMRKIVVTLRHSDKDLQSVVQSTRAVAQYLGGKARMRVRLRSEQDWELAWGNGNHHIGTTRMSTDPRTGVVDAHGKVHDFKNIFVAGSSVFPTCGMANPTLTIVALCTRLADHVSQRYLS